MTEVELAIAGMTCASCAARVAKQLNKLDGVVATVNFATETATAVVPTALRPADLIAAVEQAGYHATLPAALRPPLAAPTPPLAEPARARAARARATLRLPVSAALALPV